LAGVQSLLRGMLLAQAAAWKYLPIATRPALIMTTE
jgi:hypothetical protein